MSKQHEGVGCVKNSLQGMVEYGILSYIYDRNQTHVGKYISYMDTRGLSKKGIDRPQNEVP